MQRIHQPVRKIKERNTKFIHSRFLPERTEIDKAAATRFIKHAIAQAQWKKTAAEDDNEDEEEDDNNVTSDNTPQANSSASHIPVKVTNKMVQRAAYEKEIKEQDAMDSDEDELEVFEGDELPTTEDTKGKGKETALPTVADEDNYASRNKRRRSLVDPFAGTFDPPNIPCVIY